MSKQKLGKYYIDKKAVVDRFGSLKECINQCGLNWKKVCYGVDNIKHFNNLPKEYILERDTTPKIFIQTKVNFVSSKKDATHILKDYKGGIICKRVLG